MRANRTLRKEFYAITDLLEDTVRGIQAASSKAIQKYNAYRPHSVLKGLTPLQYINSNTSEAAA